MDKSLATHQQDRIVASLPLVHIIARRMAAAAPHAVEVSDLVQDGVLGLITAAHHFDEDRGIKFETFASSRVHGAMIDGLRRGAWPRRTRQRRRELEEAREALRSELGHEPSLADLAAKVGSDERRLNRTILRINTIESTTSPGAGPDSAGLSELVPAATEAPDSVYEKTEMCERVRRAIRVLPPRDRKVIGMYYYGDMKMKQIGVELGVTLRRVSQLHKRAIRRLHEALEKGDVG